METARQRRTTPASKPLHRSSQCPKNGRVKKAQQHSKAARVAPPNARKCTGGTCLWHDAQQDPERRCERRHRTHH
eukprot:14507148-Alexandrium_andersonii.AAC.1